MLARMARKAAASARLTLLIAIGLLGTAAAPAGAASIAGQAITTPRPAVAPFELVT